MSVTTMRGLRRELSKLLDEAYLSSDRSMIYPVPGDAIDARLDTIKEIAKLAGVRHIERKHCACCGSLQDRGYTGKYCPGNACKQKAYRIRHGQMAR